MRAIFLIGLNFVRTQWIALAVIVSYIIGIGSVYRFHTQKDDVLFFLRLHSGYAISLAVMMAVPTLQAERKTRRILAVLSKGVHRWEYLGGILFGCALISAIFCALIGGTAAWLGQQGGVLPDGLAVTMLALFCCCLASASTGLFFAVFLHPLLAIAATSMTLFLPFLWGSTGGRGSEFFPMAGLFRILGPGFESASVPWVISTAMLQTIICWIAASVVFARRDVTISPE